MIPLELHLRLLRLKLERKMTQCCRASCWTTSRCTRGVAVAVSASSGTLGYLHGLKVTTSTCLFHIALTKGVKLL